LSLKTDSSLIGKQNFLDCYQRARKEALSEEIIKNGWKATGLWPKNMAKPLMSPLLLENSNSSKTTLEVTSQATQSSNEYSEIDSQQVIWSTPKKSTEITAQAIEFQKLQDQGLSTQRLLFRKIRKGFEEQESVLVDYELKIQSLEAELEKARPKKRRKVRTSPNSKFVNIEQIRKAQIEAEGAEIIDDDEEEANKSDSTLDCIEIE
jgi:4-hydroxybenzoate polyprenyltransferase